MVEKRTKTTQQGRVSTILQSFLCAEVKQVKRKLFSINGPEFSNEEHGSAGLCSSKVSKKSSNGLYFPITSDQGPLHGKNLVMMQVRSIAMLLRRLYPCQNGSVVTGGRNGLQGLHLDVKGFEVSGGE